MTIYVNKQYLRARFTGKQRHIGKVFDILRSSTLRENNIIIITWSRVVLLSTAQTDGAPN